MRLVIGISGASGVWLGYKLLQILKSYTDIETHLVITEGAIKNFALETTLDIAEVLKLADFSYAYNNLGALIASGSFTTDGMVIVPCSMKTLAGIVHGYAENLLLRSADVCLKEHRKVVLVPREMPLGKIHLQNLVKAAEVNCVIIPPLLTFYNQDITVEQQINHILGKILMQFGLNYEKFIPWKGCE